MRPVLLAHVNYADDADLELLAGSSASVVYCPRTHAFFGHAPHRYREMLARGINVCLGTDSLASNDTLSILDEMRFLRMMDADSSDQWLV
jgi:cytosine/adenosine deaminase-related metal-dependent hydrolase